MAQKQYLIPLQIQEEIATRINVFNKKRCCNYSFQIKGKFIYLLRDGTPICRCTYNGDLEDMDFAIYKYSSEKYDPKEFCFPGAECINGTVEGAMKAGLKAY
jgi:hypothetical protein